eukprot:TRINITY_DN2337_c0_g1_i18.p1 TRINITY_DN2337_c0_g1~~TRINITY_DN2337_c0_g1_i18.p1  ORF type:complete len:762 (-),score=172.59 TRINITY_DN2337_c0_g1_i18:137-2422(-)
MGVKDFWNVASPCEERISLHQLRGETLAIDLAGWIVQNQTVPGMQHRVTRPHLRNLVFRTNSLLSLDILPVFVLDGEAPKVKAQTVESRNLAIWGPNSRSTQINSSPKVKQRRQFTGVLKECGKLLESLGVPYVIAPGEAEAYCAALDKAGLVDGVISDDSDSVCYGARTVYRNFSTDPKNFSVSKYSNKRLRKEIGISRERIVIMSLLLGCDYAPGGVSGVGKDNLTKLFNLWGQPVKGELQKVLNWKASDDRPEVGKTPHCGTCGHPGTVGAHRKNGCATCNTDTCCISSGGSTSCECAYHSESNQLAIVENSIRRKALESPGWPHLEVVEEFYSLDKMNLDHSFSWRCPVPHAFIKLCMTRMDWEQEYTLDKIQFLIARWQVKNPSKRSGIDVDKIIKSRIQGGQNMLEVEFRNSLEALPDTFTACVPTSDFEAGYPDILTTWIQEKEAKKKKPKKKKENVDPKEKQPRKKKVEPKPEIVKQPSIKQFFNTQKPSQVEPALVEELTKEIENVNLVPKKLVLTTKTYRDKKLIVSAKNVTVEREPEQPSPVVANFDIGDSLADSFDNLSLGLSKSVEKKSGDGRMGANLAKSSTPIVGSTHHGVTSTPVVNSTPNMNSTDCRGYLEEPYNSEMSDILNEIMGISGSTEKKPSSNTARLSASTSKYPPLVHKTSTPEIRIHNETNPEDFGSPLLGKMHKIKAENKENVASKKPKQVEKVKEMKQAKPATPEESSEDEFDNLLKLNSATPLMERVKKRMGH